MPSGEALEVLVTGGAGRRSEAGKSAGCKKSAGTNVLQPPCKQVSWVDAVGPLRAGCLHSLDSTTRRSKHQIFAPAVTAASSPRDPFVGFRDILIGYVPESNKEGPALNITVHVWCEWHTFVSFVPILLLGATASLPFRSNPGRASHSPLAVRDAANSADARKLR